MLRIKSPLVIALLLAFSTTFIVPPAPAYAFSLNDLLGQSSTVRESGSGSLLDIIVGLLLGKLFSNLTGNSSGSAAASPIPGSSDNATGTALINTAKKYMGTPYVWGGETPSGGFDCSGFTQYVMRLNGISIPRTAAEQFATGTPVNKDDLEIGDLVFFTTCKPGASHVGFYMCDGKFIHASSGAGQVTISELSDKYYSDRYIGARRYI